MGSLVKGFKVFICSPGDVTDERHLAMSVLKKLEDEPAFERRIHIDVVAWDKKGASVVMSGNKTPQEAVILGLPLPSECDVVIVILWSRFGTPLSSKLTREDGSPYKSGTEWEYYDALKGDRHGRKPEILVYRCMRPIPFGPGYPDWKERAAQFSLVDDFFASFTNADGSLNGGYQEYETSADFATMFSGHIRSVLHNLTHSSGPVELETSVMPSPKPRIHHNLPSRAFNLYGSLLGREADLKRVMVALESRYPLISIEGMPGVGKSSLALEIAYSCIPNADKSVAQPITFEYIVWVSAKDKPDQKVWFDDVLNVIARVMDFFAITQKPLANDKIFDVEELLQRQSTLLIIDNFETIEDKALESWLEKIPEPSKVIVTSQKRQFQMSKPIDLEGLEEKDALDLIRRHADTFGISFIGKKSADELLPLVKNTAGNPLAIVWSLGTLKGGTLSFEELIDGLKANYKNRNINKTIEYLFSRSWKNLTGNAQKVLSAVPLFVGVDSIGKNALCATIGLSDDDFDAAVSQLIEFKLLQVEYDKNGKVRFKVHPLTHTFARTKLNKRQKFETVARERWSGYFLEFIEKNITRKDPNKRYWNVLVSDKMQIIDEEWYSISEVMKWADQSGHDLLFLNLVMLLVHYMDSRFLNLYRTEYVKKVVGIAQRMQLKTDEILLRLDALGWTLVEEDNLVKAYEEIRRGFDLASQLEENHEDKNDLLTLSYAWQARVKIEMGDSVQACQLIEEALRLSVICSPWIKSRVYMAAGDIALKQNRNQDALDFYKDQVSSMNEYGGEGDGYQIEPRLGLAYVNSGNLVKAEEKFNALRVNKNIPIGKLYGDYGLALVAFKRNQKEQARQLASETKEALTRKTASNILLKLINELYDEMEAGSNQ